MIMLIGLIRIDFSMDPFHGFDSVIDFFFHSIEDLKTRYPSKDWAQIRGRLLGICNMTSNDMSLNEALNKVHCTVYTIFSIEIIVEEFELSLTSDMRLCWLCCTAICDWSRNCGSLFQPTTCKTKISHDFFTCISGTTTSFLVFMLRLFVTLSISSTVVITFFFFFFTTLDLKVLCYQLNELLCRTACSCYDKNA